MSRKWILNNGKIKKISKDVELNLLTENLIFTEDNKISNIKVMNKTSNIIDKIKDEVLDK